MNEEIDVHPPRDMESWEALSLLFERLLVENDPSWYGRHIANRHRIKGTSSMPPDAEE